jgi:methionyl-tRNA synthetase
VQRVVAMIKKYQSGLIGDVPEPSHDTAQYHEAIEKCRFDRALDEVWEQVRGINQYIDEQKPWVIAKDKEEAEHLREVLAYCAGSLVEISDLLLPFMPDTAAKIRQAFEEGFVRDTADVLFPKIEGDEPKPVVKTVEKPESKPAKKK